MKKKLLFSSLVLMGIVLAMAFKSSSKKAVRSKSTLPCYWFEVKTGYGGSTSFTNSELTFISGPSIDPPAGTNCSGDGQYACVVGFWPEQVNTATDQLLPGSWSPPGMGINRDTE